MILTTLSRGVCFILFFNHLDTEKLRWVNLLGGDSKIPDSKQKLEENTPRCSEDAGMGVWTGG